MDPLVIDIEYTAHEPWNGELICLGVRDLEDGGFRRVFGPDELDEARVMLADDRPKAAFTKADHRWLELAGWDLGGELHDIQVMAWILNENTPLSLEWVAKRYNNIEMDKRIKTIDKRPWFRDDDGKHWDMTQFRTWPEHVLQQMLDYNGRDIDTEAAVYRRLRTKLRTVDRESGWANYWRREEVPYSQVLLDMELRGLPIDMQMVQDLHDDLLMQRAEQEKVVFDLLGYEMNLQSPGQLAKMLFDKLWYQKDSVPIPEAKQEELKKGAYLSTLEGFDTKKARDEWAKEHPEGYEEYRSAIVADLAPAGFTVAKAGRGYLHGYWTRKGFDYLKTPHPVNKETGEVGKNPSTATPMLMVYHVDKPIVKELIKWRKFNKILTTYTGKYHEHVKDGRLYGRFNQTGTKTGRLSSSGPNLQNQPAHGPLGEKIRALFRGNLIIGDYSQLEPRLMAHFSGDPVLLDTYRTNKDIYLVTASGIFGETITDKEDPRRQIAKTYVLALGYGAGPKKLVEILALNGFKLPLEEVEHHFDQLQELYGVFFEFKEAVHYDVRRQGFVKTIGGRHRRLKFAFQNTSWKQQGYGERQAVNAIIQGSAGDIVRRTQVNLANTFPELPQILQVHDEIGMDHTGMSRKQAATYLPEIERIATDPEVIGFPQLRVPLGFEPLVVRSWAEKGIKTVEFDEETVAEAVGRNQEED